MNSQLHATALLLSLGVLSGVVARAESSKNIEIDGRVIGADGQAIAGARVELWPVLSRYEMGVHEANGADGAAELPAEAATASGADGRFTLAAPRAGMWTVTVRTAGCVPVRLPFLPFLEPVSLPDAVLRRDASLRVRVEDADGHPLPGARVRAEAAPRYAVAKDGPGEAVPSAWEPLPRQAVAGPDGEVHLARWEGETLRVWAVDSGTAVGEAAAGEAPLAVIRLRKTPQRRITVQEAAGTPPPGSPGIPGIPGIITRDPRSGLVLGRMAPGQRFVWISPGAGTAVLLEIADGRRISLPSASGRAVLPNPVLRSGRVLDDHRRPLAGAWVWPPEDPGAAVRSDARGVYQLEESAAAGDVQGAAAGYFLAGTETGTAGSALPTLRFEPAPPVTGTVVDEQGHPVAGALVRILPVSYDKDREWPRVWTRATGDFRFGGQIALGVGQIAVRQPGFAPASLSPVPLPSSGLRIVLRRGTTATGRVVDEAGRPAAGAVVELVRSNEESLGRAAVMEDGSFSLPHLPPGHAELRIERPGAAPFRRRQIDVPDALDVPDGGTFDLGRILAPAGATLSGRVTDSGGHPLSGVAVWLRAGDGGEWGREPATTTGADGAFAVAGLPPNEELEVDLCHEGLLPDLESLPTVPPEPLDLTLRPALRLDGTVVYSDGEPVRDAYLLARPVDETEHIETYRPCATGEKTDPTDAEGRFTLTPLEAGSYELTVSVEGFQRRQPWKTAVVPGPDSLRIVLERGATLTGRVTDPQGQPVPGAWMTANGPESDTVSALTEADGSYRLTGIETGSVLVAVTHQGFEETKQTTDIADGETVLDLVLLPKAPDAAAEEEGNAEDKTEAVLTGHIRGLEPTELAWAQIAVAHAPGADFANQGTVAEDGTYRIESLRPGDWNIRVRAGDRKVTGTVHLDKGQSEATLDLDLPAVTPITGRAVWETGEPAAGAQISFQKGFDFSATMTRHDGTFEIRLEDGTYKLSARSAGERVGIIAKRLTVAGVPVFGLEITLVKEGEEDAPEEKPSGRP